MTKGEREELAELRARVAALEGADDGQVDLDALREELAAEGWQLQPSQPDLFVAIRARAGGMPRQFQADSPERLLVKVRDHEQRVAARDGDRPVEIVRGAVAASHEEIPGRGAR